LNGNLLTASRAPIPALASKLRTRIRTHERALVVLGAPRSGTTLLATALGVHPGVALLSEECEGGMFTFVGGKLPGVKLCVPNHVDLDRRWHWYYEPLRRVRWLRQNFNYRLPRSRLSLRDMAARAELKIVCILRDPRANLDALRRRGGRSEAVCRDMLRRMYRLYERLPGEPGIEVQFIAYERFVHDPEAQLRGLCRWLELPFDPGMLEAPRLNLAYPEAGFRTDRATIPAEADNDAGADGELAALRRRHAALIGRAL
jgi:Sulfotransferase family